MSEWEGVADRERGRAGMEELNGQVLGKNKCLLTCSLSLNRNLVLSPIQVTSKWDQTSNQKEGICRAI